MTDAGSLCTEVSSRGTWKTQTCFIVTAVLSWRGELGFLWLGTGYDGPRRQYRVERTAELRSPPAAEGRKER